MSVRILTCGSCQSDCDFEGAFPFGDPGQERAYAVAWACSACSWKGLDVCPAGPLEPTPDDCLNCGTRVDDPQACGGCGMKRSDTLEMLGLSGPALPSVDEVRRLSQHGLLRRALGALNAHLANSPGDAVLWAEKGHTLHRAGLLGAAERCYRRALEAGAGADVHLSRGLVLHKARRNEEALAAYQRYLEAQPSGPWVAVAQANQANVLMDLDRHDEACALYHKAVEAEPERASHHYNLARCLGWRERWQEALRAADRGLGCASTTAAQRTSLLTEKALFLCEMERGEEGLAAADAALALAPESLRLHYLRGRALALLGQLPEALSVMEHILQRSPDHEDALRARALIQQALVGRSHAHGPS